MTTLMVVAGEASGDLHGGEILRELKAKRPDLRIIGVGGDRMRPYMDRVLADVKDFGVVGFVEVLAHLPALFRLKANLLEAARQEQVTDLLTLDYPSFNFNFAKALRKRQPGVRLHHYVCPQVWAWRAGRIPKLGHLLNTLYCLFDFEADLFKGFPVDARFVGHPLLETVHPEVSRSTFFRDAGLEEGRPLVALLPGSRRSELARLMPPLTQLVRYWNTEGGRPSVQWVLPLAPTLHREDVAPFIQDLPIQVVEGRSYAARAYAEAALVCSGTATLETALLGTPFAILYRLNALTLAMARRVVKVPHFGLANVVAGRRVAPELLQEEVQPERLAQELMRLLDPKVAEGIRKDLAEVRAKLGTPGAAARVADHLLEMLFRI